MKWHTLAIVVLYLITAFCMAIELSPNMVSQDRVVPVAIVEAFKKLNISFNAITKDSQCVYYIDLSNTSVTNLSGVAMILKDELKYYDIVRQAGYKPPPTFHLNLTGTSVSDISAIKDLPITSLSLAATEVSDLSAIKGMPIVFLSIFQTHVVDITPLCETPIETLFIDLNIEEKGLLSVLDLSTLKRINGMAPDKFRKRMLATQLSP